MQQIFETQIKPLNDELGKTLGVRKIEVQDSEKKATRINVQVEVLMPGGWKQYLEARELRSLRAIGVAV